MHCLRRGSRVVSQRGSVPALEDVRIDAQVKKRVKYQVELAGRYSVKCGPWNAAALSVKGP